MAAWQKASSRGSINAFGPRLLRQARPRSSWARSCLRLPAGWSITPRAAPASKYFRWSTCPSASSFFTARSGRKAVWSGDGAYGSAWPSDLAAGRGRFPAATRGTRDARNLRNDCNCRPLKLGADSRTELEGRFAAAQWQRARRTAVRRRDMAKQIGRWLCTCPQSEAAALRRPPSPAYDPFDIPLAGATCTPVASVPIIDVLRREFLGC
jgi:hypothetical protein